MGDPDRQHAKARFIEDTAKHEMTVEHNDGLFRSLRFANPDCFNAHYRINTWPGHLCISGDMGCFVFARLPDMFRFFRGRDINPSYWAEKLVGDDRHGHEMFCHQRFEAAIKSDFEYWKFDSDDARDSAWKEIEEDLLRREYQRDDEAIHRALEFRSSATDQWFQDFWDHRLRKYNFRFLWACYAIIASIRQYDALPANEEG